MCSKREQIRLDNEYYLTYLRMRHEISLSFLHDLSVLQVGRSRVRFPMVSLESFINIILLAALWPWGRLKPLTEMSTRNISSGVKAAGA